MATSGIVTRNVTKDECKWLNQDILAGKVLFKFDKYDYGCTGPTGIACTHSPYGDYPFFELPKNAITWSPVEGY